MKKIKLTPENIRETMSKAALVLQRGGVVVAPTDTVYGIIANADDRRAVTRVFKIKKRAFYKPIPVFIRDMNMAGELAFVSKKQKKILRKVWPGQVTAVLKAKSRKFLPGLLSEDGKIALRIPDYEFLLILLKKTGFPLTGTSANVSGKGSFLESEKVVSHFQGKTYQPDMIIEAGKLKDSLPSTVIDLVNFKIIRKGAVSPRDIFKAKKG